jgi:hypothetical protein
VATCAEFGIARHAKRMITWAEGRPGGAVEVLCTPLRAGVDVAGRADEDLYTALSNLDKRADQIEAVPGEIE